ncbi:MAG: tRNA (adenosine(37)-N6)-dimethylallyltransferase MiaA [Candidatus Cloacimonetes bacterium]|nr:tRNA (adenosine(37)-N6)-dimethylallyltransferase MiaA [Candidatus Cloacimonadota bacterium]
MLQKIIVICGPTGSGKTALSLKIAKGIDCEIVSADSRQVYRYLNIGTDKVSKKIRKEIPHHLIDIKNPDEKYTAGDFMRDADAAIKQIFDKGLFPMVVGGTGFYIKSLLYGLSNIPPIPGKIRKNLRQEMKQKSNEKLFEELKKVDPETASDIHPNDKKKIIRFLEVYRHTGRAISEFWADHIEKKRYNDYTIYLKPDRNKLYEKINDRVNKMVERGLVDEVDKLLQMGYKPSDPGLNTPGYKEIISYFNGKYDLQRAVELIKQHQRNYAKRQYTWFSGASIDLTISPTNLNISNIINKLIQFLRS